MNDCLLSVIMSLIISRHISIEQFHYRAQHKTRRYLLPGLAARLPIHRCPILTGLPLFSVFFESLHCPTHWRSPAIKRLIQTKLYDFLPGTKPFVASNSRNTRAILTTMKTTTMRLETTTLSDARTTISTLMQNSKSAALCCIHVQTDPTLLQLAGKAVALFFVLFS